MSDEYINKTWEELVVAIYDKAEERNENLQRIISDFEEEISNRFEIQIDEIKEYVESIKNKIHLCIWNRLSDATPNDLEMNQEGFLIYQEGMHFCGNVRWEENKFSVWVDDVEMWCDFIDSEDNPVFWLPLTYPCPY
jgi:hypothetical protein